MNFVQNIQRLRNSKKEIDNAYLIQFLSKGAILKCTDLVGMRQELDTLVPDRKIRGSFIKDIIKRRQAGSIDIADVWSNDVLKQAEMQASRTGQSRNQALLETVALTGLGYGIKEAVQKFKEYREGESNNDQKKDTKYLQTLLLIRDLRTDFVEQLKKYRSKLSKEGNTPNEEKEKYFNILTEQQIGLTEFYENVRKFLFMILDENDSAKRKIEEIWKNQMEAIQALLDKEKIQLVDLPEIKADSLSNLPESIQNGLNALFNNNIEKQSIVKLLIEYKGKVDEKTGENQTLNRQLDIQKAQVEEYKKLKGKFDTLGLKYATLGREYISKQEELRINQEKLSINQGALDELNKGLDKNYESVIEDFEKLTTYTPTPNDQIEQNGQKMDEDDDDL